MTRLAADVAIFGSGFAGSLTALLLHRIGLRPVLIDRAGHPRFAIGESSTPVADLVLTDLARRYDLPRILPLARFGTWQAAYPLLVCGKKRGFSYFGHEPESHFTPHAEHANELLVAASSDDAHSDTHWLRSGVDAFLVGEAIAAGVQYFDRTEVLSLSRDGAWQIVGQRDGAPVEFEAAFAIDATGEGQLLPRRLRIGDQTNKLHTHSRALFAHFRDVTPWRDVLLERGGDTADHPYGCDDAAVHQVFDDGWMWQLRFQNGIVSAGFALDARKRSLEERQTAADEWSALMARFPSLERQFAGASIVAPITGLRRTGRLQRLAAAIAGEDWALLPHTAGFIDPLHSTGIAHSLCGIERLVRILREHWQRPSLAEALRDYSEIVNLEIKFIDQIIAGCYEALGDFRRFVACSMLYFAAATTYERRRQDSNREYGGAFLCADDLELRRVVCRTFEQVQRGGSAAGMGTAQFEREVADAIGPFNHVGLCDPNARNMYRYTAMERPRVAGAREDIP